MISVKDFAPVYATYIALLLISGCSDTQTSIVNEGLVFCSEGNPDTLNPQFATSGISMDAGAHTLFNQLVEFKPGTTELMPGLAEKWHIRNDGLIYRFYLNKEVAFHKTPYFTPSRYLNADDVLFSFNRQRLKGHSYHDVSNRKYPYFESMGLRDLIVDIKKLDDHTIEFILSRPESPFLATLAMEFASILSAEYAQQRLDRKEQELFDLYPIGTGPFVFKRHVQDAFIRFYRHENYFRGPERIKYLVFAISPEPSLRYARLTAGECDVMANPLPAYLNAIEQNKDLSIREMTGLNIGYWAFNTQVPPLDNPLVRKALSHAVNRKAILEAVHYNAAQMAESPLPPSIWGHDESLHTLQYNPLLAKKLLHEAGVKDLSIDIWISPIQRPYNPDALKTAELIVRSLERINIKANIVSYEWSTFLSKVSKGEHQTALLGWFADNGDPDNFLTPLLSCKGARSGSNRAFWCHSRFDGLINQARITIDQKQRAQLYLQAQKIFKQETPWLTIAHASQYVVSRNYVKNLQQSPVGGFYFSGVYLERSE